MSKLVIDYTIRPSKAVQRYMIVDVCRRLTAFASLSDYQYIGFGGLEFIDFDLIHRSLGVEKMISIEQDTGQMQRYRFNAPFSTVSVLFGDATSHLPSIPWARFNIVWLDYTSTLTDSVITDVLIVCGKLESGSVLFLTLNSEPERQMAGRRDSLADRIGEDRIPAKVTDESLAKWGLARVQRQVITDIAVAALRGRELGWRQVLDIQYADNARMQTVGAVVLSDADRQKFEDCRFHDLEFVRFAGEDALTIRVPVLTAKERRALDEKFPLPTNPGALGLPDRDIEAYRQVYRYCGNAPRVFA
jgi:hypothetical protein